MSFLWDTNQKHFDEEGLESAAANKIGGKVSWDPPQIKSVQLLVIAWAVLVSTSAKGLIGNGWI